jgi:ornithine carbamoyltransferase
MPEPLSAAKRPTHLLTIADTPSERVVAILERAVRLRSRPEPALLTGKTLLCLFEKPSLRTRVSFEQAMRKLGGGVISMHGAEVGIGGRESPHDVARVLSSMVDAIMARVMLHDTLETFASVSTVPVINGLSDYAHPAQALADALTLVDEFSPGSIAGVRGRTVAFVGDGNNVARSLCAVCCTLGMNFVICAPEGYELDQAWIDRVRAAAPRPVTVEQTSDPDKAVAHADAIYCDTFISMGQEHERAERLNVFSGYQVDRALVAAAPAHAIVLHCLPASRGVEITDEVLDGPRSRVFPQARNRLDAQMGLLAELLGG